MSHSQKRKYNRRVAAAKRTIERRFSETELNQEKHGQFNVHEPQKPRTFSVIIPKREVYHNAEVITLKNTFH